MTQIAKVTKQTMYAYKDNSQVYHTVKVTGKKMVADCGNVTDLLHEMKIVDTPPHGKRVCITCAVNG